MTNNWEVEWLTFLWFKRSFSFASSVTAHVFQTEPDLTLLFVDLSCLCFFGPACVFQTGSAPTFAYSLWLSEFVWYKRFYTYSSVSTHAIINIRLKFVFFSWENEENVGPFPSLCTSVGWWMDRNTNCEFFFIIALQ